MQKPFSFRHFFLRSWLWNMLISALFGCLAIYFWFKITGLQGNRTMFLTLLIISILAGVHGLLLLIFFIRRLTRKEWIPALCFLFQGILGTMLCYYLFALWLLSMTMAFR